MTTFSIKVEPFAGTDIDAACAEAVRLANAWGIVVTFGFSGVTCMARPGDSPLDLAAAWAQELKSKHPNKLACASRAERAQEFALYKQYAKTDEI